MPSQLEQLKQMTTVVADTGDIQSIEQYSPQDATTNPSLVLAAMQNPAYRPLMDEAFAYSKKASSPQEQMSLLLDKLFVNVGAAILKLIPGRVSTEVDARLSFDVEGSVRKAHSLIALYREMGIASDRILIKLASTWEGGLAAEQLEKSGIHCNMTLLFSLEQAIHCANAQVTLISPFVGRITDWYKKEEKVEGYSGDKDPGVQSVKTIFDYYKQQGIKTEIMGASFRNKEQILALAGCDLLTISPHLLAELNLSTEKVEQKLDANLARNNPIPRLEMDENRFRWGLNENAMATEKLAEGIRNFAKDAKKLEELVRRTYAI